jgi:hypothetical protein
LCGRSGEPPQQVTQGKSQHLRKEEMDTQNQNQNTFISTINKKTYIKTIDYGGMVGRPIRPEETTP